MFFCINGCSEGIFRIQFLTQKLEEKFLEEEKSLENRRVPEEPGRVLLGLLIEKEEE